MTRARMAEMTDGDIESFKSKLESISFGAGRKPRVVVDRKADVKHVELINPETGQYGGHNTHHADGTWDGTVNASPIRSGLRPAKG